MAETTGWDSPWAVRVIGLVTALILLVVVLAGVKWVVKLQLLLLAILMLSVLDFLVGTFAHTDYGRWHCKVKAYIAIVNKLFNFYIYKAKRLK